MVKLSTRILTDSFPHDDQTGVCDVGTRDGAVMLEMAMLEPVMLEMLMVVLLRCHNLRFHSSQL